MANIESKLLRMKALLGDTAAQAVLDEAAAKEAAAKTAGVEFKEKKTTTKAKEETPAPTSLSELLAKIDAGLENGTIVNDVEESETEVDAEAKAKEVEAQTTALKELIGEVLDEKLAKYFKAAEEKQTEKEQQPDPKRVALEAKMKEAQESLAKVQKELAELQGDQPKSAGFRPSQADSTVVKETSPKTAPHNGFDSFVNEFVMGNPAAPVQP